jgi:hypothetical protein
MVSGLCCWPARMRPSGGYCCRRPCIMNSFVRALRPDWIALFHSAAHVRATREINGTGLRQLNMVDAVQLPHLALTSGEPSASDAAGAKHWVGGDSCVWGLIWGLLARFTGPKRPFAHHGELQSGSELGECCLPSID